MIEPSHSEIKAFVGRGANYYLKAWFPADPLALPISGKFNGSALMGGVMWLAYRKLYFEGAVYFGIFVMLQVAMSMLIALLMLAFPGFLSSSSTFNALVAAIPIVAFLTLAFFCGTYGNLCYQNYVYKQITEVKSQENLKSEKANTLAKRGGVNVLSAIAAAVLLGCMQWLLVRAFNFAFSAVMSVLAS